MTTIEQYSNCTYTLRALGKPYPRTCAECGLGPCKTRPAPAVQKSAIEVERDTLKSRNAELEEQLRISKQSEREAWRYQPELQGRVDELEAMLAAVGAGGVGDAIKPAQAIPDSMRIDALWQEFCRTSDYRKCLQWARNCEFSDALFLAFRSGVAVKAIQTTQDADSRDAAIKEAVMQEREECAKVCDNRHYAWRFGDGEDSSSGPKECAELIRARAIQKFAVTHSKGQAL